MRSNSVIARYAFLVSCERKFASDNCASHWRSFIDNQLTVWT